MKNLTESERMLCGGGIFNSEWCGPPDFQIYNNLCTYTAPPEKMGCIMATIGNIGLTTKHETVILFSGKSYCHGGSRSGDMFIINCTNTWEYCTGSYVQYF